MSETQSMFNQHLPPLAERIRPGNINQFVGQEHLVGTEKILSMVMEKEQPFSMMFWGPPGSGKTTLARIIAKTAGADIHKLSAVSSGVKDLRKVIRQGEKNKDLGKLTILFIDEIHRFSKSQQDSLLNAVEDGTVILIGATTENPSFEIISPLLSRCKVLALNPLSSTALDTILDYAFNTDIILQKNQIDLSQKIREQLIQSAGGDARKMLNTLEVSMHLISGKGPITEKILSEALQRRSQLYDKTGDYHYDTIILRLYF